MTWTLAGGPGDLPGEWWERIVAGFTRSAPPSITATELLVILLAAAVLSVPRATWRYFGLFVTVVHELGHAFAALTTGRVLTGIRLNFDQSGTTSSFGRGRAVWAGFWGYPVPALVGAALFWAGIHGWASAALSAGTILLVLTVLFIRNWQGLLIILGSVFAVSALVLFAPVALLAHFIVAIGAGLLVGAVRDWLNVVQVHLRRRHQLRHSDAFLLYRSTGVPSAVWLALFALVIAGGWALACGQAAPVLAASGA